MCGRYVLYGPSSRHREHFGVEDDFDLAPRYNVAPSQMMPVVRQDADGKRHFMMAKWGLVPSWVKDPTGLPHPINAKAESARDKPMFRHAFRRSRVLVPADGFYEWKLAQGQKQPYFIHMRDGAPFGIAGLIEHRRDAEGELWSFAVLVTDANPLLAAIHDRMPVIIRPDYYGEWLDPALTDADSVMAMIGSYDGAAMEAYPVSREVNKPANEGPQLIAPLAGR